MASNYNAHQRQATAALLVVVVVAISSPSVLKLDRVVMLSRQQVSGLPLSEYALFVPSCSVAHNPLPVQIFCWRVRLREIDSRAVCCGRRRATQAGRRRYHKTASCSTR